MNDQVSMPNIAPDAQLIPLSGLVIHSPFLFRGLVILHLLISCAPSPGIG